MYKGKYISPAEIRFIAETNCEHPVRVELRDGRRIYVPCGKCTQCLKRRRASWSKRLVDEYSNIRCIHAFGFTLTYDSKHVPYLNIDVLENETYSYQSNGHIALDRGASVEKLTDGTAVSLLCSEDIQNFIKLVRTRLERPYEASQLSKEQREYLVPYNILPTDIGKYFVRYFIAGEYGETDNIKGGRTARAHYHGIMYVYTKDVATAEGLRSNPNELARISRQIELMTLSCWPHARHFWDSKKNRWAGKSIEKFGENWGNYLGKYVNKEITSSFTGCTGAKWISERIWCSRASEHYGLGSLGMSFFEKQSRYSAYMNELEDCVSRGLCWQPTYSENGFHKALPVAYKRCLLQDYFGIKFSKLAKYIWLGNYLRDNKQTESAVTFVLDEGDPLELLYATELTYKSTAEHYYKIKWRRKRSSIAKCPSEVEELRYLPFFTRKEMQAMDYYLNWQQLQVNHYYNSVAGDASQNPVAVYLDADGYLISELEDSNEMVANAQAARRDIVYQCLAAKEAAICKKHAHAVHNGYIRG